MFGSETTPSAAPVVKAGWTAMIPAATATAPNDISTFNRQRSGVTPSEGLEPLGPLRGKLALFYQPGDVENDLATLPR